MDVVPTEGDGNSSEEWYIKDEHDLDSDDEAILGQPKMEEFAIELPDGIEEVYRYNEDGDVEVSGRSAAACCETSPINNN